MKYFKLGKTASSFYDSKSTLSISNKAVVAMENGKCSTKKVQRALESGHIIEVNEAEFNTYTDSVEEMLAQKAKGKTLNVSAPDDKKDQEGDEDEEDLDSMTKDQLIKYVEVNFELDDVASKDFSSKKKQEMVDQIKEWNKA
jgi:hypothetical protein